MAQAARSSCISQGNVLKGNKALSYSLSEQDTPAPKRPPPLGQETSAPSCRQWARDISVPEHLTPLMTTLSALTSPCQYQVSLVKRHKEAFCTPFSHFWGLLGEYLSLPNLCSLSRVTNAQAHTITETNLAKWRWYLSHKTSHKTPTGVNLVME